MKKFKIISEKTMVIDNLYQNRHHLSISISIETIKSFTFLMTILGFFFNLIYNS